VIERDVLNTVLCLEKKCKIIEKISIIYHFDDIYIVDVLCLVSEHTLIWTISMTSPRSSLSTLRYAAKLFNVQ